ncbi:unnamed protein product [Calypogeia fissa]
MQICRDPDAILPAMGSVCAGGHCSGPYGQFGEDLRVESLIASTIHLKDC